MARKHWRNKTPYDVKRSPRNLNRGNRVSGVIRRESSSTGEDVEEHWTKIRGEEPRIAGDSLAILEAMLEKLK